MEPKLEPLDGLTDVPPKPDNFRNPNPISSLNAPLAESNVTIAIHGCDVNNARSEFTGKLETEMKSFIEEHEDVEITDPDDFHNPCPISSLNAPLTESNVTIAIHRSDVNNVPSEITVKLETEMKNFTEEDEDVEITDADDFHNPSPISYLNAPLTDSNVTIAIHHNVRSDFTGRLETEMKNFIEKDEDVEITDLDDFHNPSPLTESNVTIAIHRSDVNNVRSEFAVKLETEMKNFTEEDEDVEITDPDDFHNPSPISYLNAPLAESNVTIVSHQSNINNVPSEFTVKSEITDPDSLAIVPVPEENELSTVQSSSRRKSHQRSAELVRVTNLEIKDERYFREIVRKTRMLFDSLWIFVMFEDDKLRSVSHEHMIRGRGDVKAATLMKNNNLWLNRDKRIVGRIPGINIGDVFFFRMELCVLGIHGQNQAGIDYLSSNQSSNGEPIATSVIVSGGYEDDEDSGDVIIYTGHGGQDKKKQVEHQKLEGGNLGMERSMHHGIEVRVIRGFKYKGGPTEKVYVYDGIYKIVKSWFEIGKSGFGVYKFKLVRIENQPEMGSAIFKFAENIRDNPLKARPVGYVSLDISKKKENVPVFLFNDIDDDYEPLDYDYLVKTIFPPFVYNHPGNGCRCIYGCTPDCVCGQKNGGEIAYDFNGLLLKGKPLIFECGPLCSCPPRCRNRVTQKGVKNKFEIFRSIETGWGVRSLDLIQSGSFICEYTGVILTRDQSQVFTMNGEDSLVYPNRFGQRWSEWGDFSQIFADYKRPLNPSLPPLEFAMDVSRMRNVACYMSHSSCPNVFVQLVMFDHSNYAFPHLMLFAMEDIPPLRELSLDYGTAGEWTEKKLSICN